MSKYSTCAILRVDIMNMLCTVLTCILQSDANHVVLVTHSVPHENPFTYCFLLNVKDLNLLALLQINIRASQT